MKVLACIVTFNPDIVLLTENIQSICSQVDKILIVDNGSDHVIEIEHLSQTFAPMIELIANSENKGIAEALNQSLAYAVDHGFKWLLTLDQDSICEQEMVGKYCSYINHTAIDNVLLLCPAIHMAGILEPHLEDTTEQLETTLTSGSFVHITNAKKIGGFDARMFIDYVDFDFCIRGKLNQLEIIRLNNTVLFHQLGETELRHLLSRPVFVTHHKPIRRYYLFRNKVYLYRKYWGKYNHWIRQDIKSSVRILIVIGLFEKNRLEKFRSIVRGLKDGFHMRLEQH